MISFWQLSTWHIHRSLIEISKSKCKICQQNFIPHQPAFPDTHLQVFSISVSDTTSTQLFKLETMKPLLVLPFPWPRHSIHHWGHLPNTSPVLPLCFIALVWVTITSHLNMAVGSQMVSLSAFFFPPTHSLVLYTIICFSPASTLTSISYFPVLALSKSQTSYYLYP